MNIEPEDTDRIPQPARNVLYAIFVVLSIAAPFVTAYTDEVFTQAYITANSVIGGFAGVVALAHPKHRRQ